MSWFQPVEFEVAADKTRTRDHPGLKDPLSSVGPIQLFRVHPCLRVPFRAAGSTWVRAFLVSSQLSSEFSHGPEETRFN